MDRYLLDMPPLPHPWPRTFQAYCVGLNKTGTTSMSRIFSRYVSYHDFKRSEPELMLALYRKGRINKREFEKFLLRRDHKMWAEMESSGGIHRYIDSLINIFPRSKFILTLRDCYSWCDSYIDASINHPYKGLHPPLNPLFFKDKESAARNIIPILNYALSMWRDVNEWIMKICPPERLLVVNTDHILKDIGDIADFLEIPVDSLLPEMAHSNQSQRKYHVLSTAPYSLLKSIFEEKPMPVMQKYFPQFFLDDFLRSSSLGAKRATLRQIKREVEDMNTPEPWLKRVERAIRDGNYKEARYGLVQFENFSSHPNYSEMRRFLKLYLIVRGNLSQICS